MLFRNPAMPDATPLKLDAATTALVLIGNDSRHLWTRADGLSSAAKLVKVINDVSQGLNTDTPQERKQP